MNVLAFPYNDPKVEIAGCALFLHQIADKADEIARRYFGSPLAVEHKADQSPVTVADKEIEIALLEKIRQHYPDHGVYGEESARINPQAEWQWVIDPIDGTRAFVAGKPTFTTLVALCHQGVPIVSVISQAIKKERWIGGDGAPNHSDNLPAQTLADAHIATTSHSYFSASEMTSFRSLENQTATTLLNHDGYAFGMVADGRLDIALDVKLKPYDFCALAPVIETAGGTITDWHGKPLTLESEGRVLAARTQELHAQALAVLQAG